MAIRIIILLACFALSAKAVVYNVTWPDTLTWRANVIAAGSNVGSDSLRRVNDLNSNIKQFGLWTNCYTINPRAGTNLTACAIRLKVPAGTNVSEGISNFVAADFVERGSLGGLTGNGSTKFINTWTTSSAVGSAVSLWQAVLSQTGITTGQATFIGARGNASLAYYDITWDADAPRLGSRISNTGNLTAGTNAQQVGFIGADGGTGKLYKNSATIGSAGGDGGAGGSSTDVTLYVGALNNAGNTVINVTSNRLGCTIVSSFLHFTFPAGGGTQYGSMRMGEIGYAYERSMERLP